MAKDKYKVLDDKKKFVKSKIKKEKEVTITVSAWLAISGIRRHEWHPRKVYAHKYGKTKLTKKEWNDFFKKY